MQVYCANCIFISANARKKSLHLYRRITPEIIDKGLSQLQTPTERIPFLIFAGQTGLGKSLVASLLACETKGTYYRIPQAILAISINIQPPII